MTENKEGIQHKYRDLIKLEGRKVMLKDEEELESTYNWWSYLQIKNLFNMDKKDFGFRENNTDMENILLEGEGKIISKLYKLLLEWYTADERVKEQMVKWALNTNTEIAMDQWKYLWKRSIKISPCVNFQENCYKLFYRWCMTPKKLARIYKNSSNIC